MPLPLLVLGWGAIGATVVGLGAGIFRGSSTAAREGIEDMFFWVTLGGGLLTLFNLLPLVWPRMRRKKR